MPSTRRVGDGAPASDSSSTTSDDGSTHLTPDSDSISDVQQNVTFTQPNEGYEKKFDDADAIFNSDEWHEVMSWAAVRFGSAKSPHPDDNDINSDGQSTDTSDATSEADEADLEMGEAAAHLREQLTTLQLFTLLMGKDVLDQEKKMEKLKSVSHKSQKTVKQNARSIKTSKAKYTRLSNDVTDLEDQVDSLDNVITNHSERLAAQDEELEQLKTEKAAITSSNSALHSKVESLATSVQDQLARIDAQDLVIEQVKAENTSLRQCNVLYGNKLETALTMQKSQTATIASQQDHLSVLYKMLDSEVEKNTTSMSSTAARLIAVESRLAGLKVPAQSGIQEASTLACAGNAREKVSAAEARDLLNEFKDLLQDVKWKQLKLDELSSTVESLHSGQSIADKEVKIIREALDGYDEKIDTIGKATAYLLSRLDKALDGVDDCKSDVDSSRLDIAAAKEVSERSAAQFQDLAKKYDELRGELSNVAWNLDSVALSRDSMTEFGFQTKSSILRLQEKVDACEAFKAEQLQINEKFQTRLTDISHTSGKDLISEVNKISEELKKTDASVEKVSKALDETTDTVKRLASDIDHADLAAEATKLQQTMESVARESQRLDSLDTTTQILSAARDSGDEKLNEFTASISQSHSLHARALTRMNRSDKDLKDLKAKVDSLASAQTGSTIQRDNEAQGGVPPALNSTSIWAPQNFRTENGRAYIPPRMRRGQRVQQAGWEIPPRRVEGLAAFRAQQQ